MMSWTFFTFVIFIKKMHFIKKKHSFNVNSGLSKSWFKFVPDFKLILNSSRVELVLFKRTAEHGFYCCTTAGYVYVFFNEIDE